MYEWTAVCMAHSMQLSAAGLLNLFWGVLVFKKKAERALEASGIPYVIVRPGGMERPTDTYKRTHNVRLATRDKLFGGQVSRLQVAELIAAAVTNPDVAQNKVRQSAWLCQCSVQHGHFECACMMLCAAMAGTYNLTKLCYVWLVMFVLHTCVAVHPQAGVCVYISASATHQHSNEARSAGR